jgi:hypothetical protein
MDCFDVEKITADDVFDVCRSQFGIANLQVNDPVSKPIVSSARIVSDQYFLIFYGHRFGSLPLHHKP